MLGVDALSDGTLGVATLGVGTLEGGVGAVAFTLGDFEFAGTGSVI